MSLTDTDPPEPSPAEVPHGLAVSDCRDRLEAEHRVVRRHFWRRLLPGVGVTSYLAVSTAVGVGGPVLWFTVGFGLLTAREAVRFRSNLVRLRALEAELAALTAGDRGEGDAGEATPRVG